MYIMETIDIISLNILLKIIIGLEILFLIVFSSTKNLFRLLQMKSLKLLCKDTFYNWHSTYLKLSNLFFI